MGDSRRRRQTWLTVGKTMNSCWQFGHETCLLGTAKPCAEFPYKVMGRNGLSSEGGHAKGRTYVGGLSQVLDNVMFPKYFPEAAPAVTSRRRLSSTGCLADCRLSHAGDGCATRYCAHRSQSSKMTTLPVPEELCTPET